MTELYFGELNKEGFRKEHKPNNKPLFEVLDKLPKITDQIIREIEETPWYKVTYDPKGD